MALAWDRFLGNVPIRFYGRVVDSNGKAIENVQIRAEVVWNRFIQIPAPFHVVRGRRTITTTTDAGGNFNFHAFRGTYLEIVAIEKSGWKLKDKGSGMRTTFGYPASSNPPIAIPDDVQRKIVYTMVKAE